MTQQIGAPLDRIDGRLKVTGGARYGADFPVPGPLHAHYVMATVGRGRILAIDSAEAEAVPGVRKVYSHFNRPAIRDLAFFGTGGRGQQSWFPLNSPEVRFHGMPVAFVVAETILAAREASKLVRVRYEAGSVAATLDSRGVTVARVEASPRKEMHRVGDVNAAMASSAHRVEETYDTPAQMHNTIELFACTAYWSGDQLTVHEPSQWVVGLQAGVAEQLGIEPARVRVVCPYVGGAFGGKGSVTARTALCAVAAKEFNRPVKLYVSREEGFTEASFRAETRQRVRMGASADGTLVAFEHTGRELTSRADPYSVNGGEASARMYGWKNIRTGLELVHADRQTPGFMRAPAEVPYFFALEGAMDEMARKVGMDPVAFRLKNDTMVDPVSGKPFTSRSLAECYRQAGEMFGWKDYRGAVGAMRDGDDLVGWGVATATYPTQMAPSAVRVHLDVSGDVRVQVAAHDVGTGAYTVIAQGAAARLGVPVGRVQVELGDSSLPPGPVSGGSVTTASVVSCLEIACDRMRARLGVAEGAPLELAAAFERYGQAGIEEYAEWSPPAAGLGAARSLYEGKVRIVGGGGQERSAFSFGAEFVEVRVNRHTREIRVPRIVGAFAAGRIMNEKTARSQLLGGMVWGIGSALHEGLEIDPRTGEYVNDNIAEYLVPVNADIRQIEAILVPEVDTQVNPAGIKGIGELSVVGTSAAIAAAVFHATGVRVRRTPIRVEDLLPRV